MGLTYKRMTGKTRDGVKTKPLISIPLVYPQYSFKLSIDGLGAPALQSRIEFNFISHCYNCSLVF